MNQWHLDDGMLDDPVAHCWEGGPPTDDGMSTTCMLLADHRGPHRWFRDDEISVTFLGDNTDE